MITLRQYQDKLAAGVRGAFSRLLKKVLAVLPTGGGKTIVFTYMAGLAAKAGLTVWILAHRIELLEQCGEKLFMNEVEFGYISPKYAPNPIAKVQVGSMQTVVKRMVKLRKPDLIIIDEAHRSIGATYKKIIEANPQAKVIGFTATPVRGDGKPLAGMYQDMIVGPSIKELIEMGSLVKPVTFAPLERLDLSDIQTIAGDYNKDELSKKMNTSAITGNVVEHYRKVCHNWPAVAFCVSIEHAKQVAADFRAAGYISCHIDGSMTSEDPKDKKGQPMLDDEGRPIMGRKSILNGLKEGKIHVVTSVDLITEGFDAPMLMVAIMLRPTKSEGLYLQMAGRVLRPFPGKTMCIILDHAGCIWNHGLVDEERDWTLDELEYKRRKKKASEKLIGIKQCPKCFRTHAPAPSCPSCGHVYVVVGRAPDEIDAWLAEVTPDAAALIRNQKRKRVGMCKSLEELEALGKELGYKPEWAGHVWGARNVKQKIV